MGGSQVCTQQPGEVLCCLCRPALCRDCRWCWGVKPEQALLGLQWLGSMEVHSQGSPG